MIGYAREIEQVFRLTTYVACIAGGFFTTAINESSMQLPLTVRDWGQWYVGLAALIFGRWLGIAGFMIGYGAYYYFR